MNIKTENIKFFIIAFLLLVLKFTCSFSTSINSVYNDSDVFSDTLISGTIYAEHYGIPRNSWSSLGRFSGIMGTMYNYETFITNQVWENGYNRYYPEFIVNRTNFTESLLKEGYTVEFSNREEFLIKKVTIQDNYLIVRLSTDKVLSEKTNGSLLEIKVKNNGNYLSMGEWRPYYSQFGLQGKVFRRLSIGLTPEKAIVFFHFLCGMFSALTFIIICYFLLLKFNFLFAIVFYITVFSSPWIINLSRNLYWLEFFLFLPMLCGLICSYKETNKIINIVCYIFSFLLFFIKSLCGYEYLTTIIISLIAFPLMDFVIAVKNRDRCLRNAAFRNIILLGLFAVVGFALAFTLHSYYWGGGSIIRGFINQKENIIRRLSGINQLSMFHLLSLREFEAIFANRIEVLAIYFIWHTEIITGIPGGMFSFLCLTPIIIFYYDYRKKNLDIRFIILYIVFFISSISWFIIAKDHSYVHIHLNFILWYLGFIQVCFYIIIKKCFDLFADLKK